ncbi:hypothetical protein IDG96_02495 [Pelagibacterales bacterium SAG-MED16]|nr:hypothetical protein [Pelagibacterales bacterium SAG-MED16]|tara:strand:+ start:15506 stop:16426 length:921 start_codon:yes stop_codon:yes gene_type:complete
MINLIYKLINKFYLENKKNDTSKILLAKSLIHNIKKISNLQKIEEIEFKVFSQFGDDGIIQFLINQIDLPKSRKFFIEFGVENYNESNTKFLLLNDNWSGLIIDGGKTNINLIKNSYYYWKHDLSAHNFFITRENLNNFFKKKIKNKNIGILSIDIDGNDYWIWESIEEIEPIFVIIEYNSLFGESNLLTIPYDSNFERVKSHYSCKYYGASLSALKKLGESKGYKYLFTNSARNNAYFVKNNFYDKINLKNFTQTFEYCKFRESRNKNGELNFKSAGEVLYEIKNLNLMDLKENRIKKISDIFKL